MSARTEQAEEKRTLDEAHVAEPIDDGFAAARGPRGGAAKRVFDHAPTLCWVGIRTRAR